MNILIKILFIILVILLSLVNSHFFDLIWLDFGWYVDGNYEFSKSIFFNIISSFIIILFFINNIGKKVKFPNILFVISGVIILSSIFSEFTLTSIFGENGKGHGGLLFLNLIGLFIVLINQKKENLKLYLNYGIYTILFVIFFSIKEYYFPTFDYGNLTNRAIGTFGHPNFLALYLILFFPLVVKNIKNTLSKKIKIVNYFIIFLIIFTLLITQSIWGIFILFSYILSQEYFKHKEKINKKYLIILSLLLIFILTYIIYNFGLITKLNSFVSRFYIWETVILISIDNVKNLLFGLGADTLFYTFDSYKIPELYIFENYGYTSDRPHNLGLNILYHFGIIGFGIFIYLIINFYKQIKKRKYKKKNINYIHSIIIFLIFTVFNFASVASYFILILLISKISKNKKDTKIIIFTPFVLIGFFSIYSSIIYYSEEFKTLSNNIYESRNKYYQNLTLENPEKKVFEQSSTYGGICKELILEIKSVENYFYCGNSLWKTDKNLAKKYYNLGLKKLPDMWDENSKYYNNYFVKKLFVPARFYNEKFGDLDKILERVGIQKKN